MQNNSADVDGATESESCFWEHSPADENKICKKKCSRDGEGEEREMLKVKPKFELDSSWSLMNYVS